MFERTQPVPNPNPVAELQGKILGVPLGAHTYFAYQVDKPVTQRPGGPSPVYPESLRAAKTDGQVIAAFVVDTTGTADMTTLHILKSTHALFTSAVRDALPTMKFVPAQLHGVKVRQLVQQPFVFTLKK